MLKSKKEGDVISLVPLENLASKYDDICPGAARSVREGMPEMLTLTNLGLPDDLLKLLASTNIMESVIARGSWNVTRWRNAPMGLRWIAAGMLMAQQGFRRVNGPSHLSSWLTLSTGSTTKGRAASPGGWPPVRRETRGSRGRTGSFRKCGRRRVEARHSQSYVCSAPKSAVGPIPGSWSPEMRA